MPQAHETDLAALGTRLSASVAHVFQKSSHAVLDPQRTRAKESRSAHWRLHTTQYTMMSMQLRSAPSLAASAATRRRSTRAQPAVCGPSSSGQQLGVKRGSSVVVRAGGAQQPGKDSQTPAQDVRTLSAITLT